MKIATAYTKSIIGDIEHNIASTTQMLEELDAQSVDFVSFPEMNISGYLKTKMSLDKFYKQRNLVISKLKSISKTVNGAFSVGYPNCVNGLNYIEQAVFHKGDIVAVHAKTHLSINEQESYQFGNNIEVFALGRNRIGTQLCYESHFPEISYIQSQKGADIISFSFASPRESSAEKIKRFKNFLCARAYDNSVYIMACNYNGLTENSSRMNGLALIINPKGVVVAETIKPDNGYCVATIDDDLLDRIRNSRMAYFNKHKRVDFFKDFYEKQTANEDK